MSKASEVLERLQVVSPNESAALASLSVSTKEFIKFKKALSKVKDSDIEEVYLEADQLIIILSDKSIEIGTEGFSVGE